MPGIVLRKSTGITRTPAILGAFPSLTLITGDRCYGGDSRLAVAPPRLPRRMLGWPGQQAGSSLPHLATA